MRLPTPLQIAIEEFTARCSKSELVKAREELSSSYRKQPSSAHMTTNSHHLAYLSARLPATFSAVDRVLKDVLPRVAQKISSFLDLGAGPGTASWAFSEQVGEIDKITLMEKDSELLALGKKLSRQSMIQSLVNSEWVLADLESIQSFPEHDVVVFSYSLGELPEEKQADVLKLASQATRNVLIIIEPGTPAGFERIRRAREELISLGNYVVAPCPHAKKCPMPQGDWCHFYSRVERSSLHRNLKGGSLGYEDEKFSYIAVSKLPCELPEGRILRHPLKRPGHMHFKLCTREHLEDRIISKRTPELYKRARNSEWGDIF